MKLLVAFALVVVCLPTTFGADCTGDGKPEATGPCDCGTANTAVNGCKKGDACDKAADGGKGKCKPAPADPDAADAPLRCQEKDGKLMPSATICEDKIPTKVCESFFNATAADKRSENCDLPEMRDTALKCAKTCMICCETLEHGCQDDPSYGIDCRSQKSMCSVSMWTEVMSNACALTCGLCGAGSCKDGVQGCGAMQHLCWDYSYRAFMSTNCARTCKLCGRNAGGLSAPTSNCVDTGGNCGPYATFCRGGSAADQAHMQANCKKTCGIC